MPDPSLSVANLFSVTGKTVLVTGGSRGIGEMIAAGFLANGATVYISSRKAAACDATAARLAETYGGTCVSIPADLSTLDGIDGLVEAMADVERLDVLVNNAGANRRGEIERYAPEELAQVVHVNLVAPITLTRLALPHLRRSGRGGAIVNVASLAGRVPLVHEAVYSATKFGLRAFTFALAEELRASGVRVSVVSPGPIATDFILADPDQVPDLVFSQPMSTAEQIAALVLDCAADGTLERVRPALGAKMATLGYLFPALRRVTQPLLERRGRAAKARHRKHIPR